MSLHMYQHQCLQKPVHPISLCPIKLFSCSTCLKFALYSSICASIPASRCHQAINMRGYLGHAQNMKLLVEFQRHKYQLLVVTVFAVETFMIIRITS